ncbi:DsbA family protein [Pajaroellobacter abortibovis]|uniref:Thioredoxin domain-containing protein n=1 Tax=Pajaroellobacter abortibovis TaxID=1882918 RepID=A0A1L6MV86_9BACT|nr:thioredoxin domain-containing protein [Pajaroellobacter abortibovis]APR99377.1 hypothetical protein BCY86_00795 [Pajaroellobacter abortibovis]
MGDHQKETTPPHHLPGGINAGVAWVGFLLCFITGLGLMWGYDQYRLRKGLLQQEGADVAAWSEEEASIPVSSQDPMWGDRFAPVTIVQFSDFQCPFCSRVENTLNELKEFYKSNKIRIFWKNEPLSFHPHAKPAAEAAQGVFAMGGSEAFWKFHALAFKNQQSLTAENFHHWAKEASIADLNAYDAGLTSHKWAQKVEKDHDLASRSGVRGTPAFFINGILLSGAQPIESFKKLIDQELEKAKAKIASGIPKEKLYTVLSQANQKNAPPPEKEEKEDTKTVFKVEVGNSPVRGDRNALVTIIEFSDFQCPFCRRVEETLQKVTETYGDQVRLVWKHQPLPFHSRAEPAAEFTLEARAQKGDKGFWEAHDRLFNIAEKTAPSLEDADLNRIANEIGLNVKGVEKALAKHKYQSVIEEDQNLADDMQASGTPHFFINGRRLAGAQPFTSFKKIIDEEIEKAKSLLNQGIPREKLYETLIKDGKAAHELEKKKVASAAHPPLKGPMNAPVVIQLFSDFQCPYCKRIEESIAKIVEEFGPRVRVEWRNLPLDFHMDAKPAAFAALAAYHQRGADGFWKMHDKLFENQGGDGFKREKLDTYAQQLGLDMKKWAEEMDHPNPADVEADIKAAKEAGITGTPALVINGYFINGAQSLAKIKRVVNRALTETKQPHPTGKI